MSDEPRPGAGRRVMVVTGAIFLLLLAIGTIPRVLRHRELEASVEQADAAPVVRIVRARRGAASGDLLLPGTVQAMREASLDPRSSGYVRRFSADIGSHVRAGQLLAEIGTPKIDQELAQARAGLAQVRAAHSLAQASLKRWESMVKDSAATEQELDERRAAFAAAEANVEAATANVRRLEETQGFGRVVAPFAGVVTARNVEVGQLVSPAQGARPLFVLAQADTVRVMISVPAAVAGQVAVGASTDVLVRDLSSKPFTGHVARTSGALDATSRTMLTEIDVPNPRGALLPGMYAQVRISARPVIPGLLIPANALLVRATGPQVATVVNGKVHIARIEIGRDLGTELEILSGLDDGAQVVINPSDQVTEGAAVRVATEGKEQ